MILNGWKNKKGTSDRKCTCGSWKQHWINVSGKKWPKVCSIRGCNNEATLGAHIFHPNVEGEQIVPSCEACNNPSDKDGAFSLKSDTVYVPANKSKTCEKDKVGWNDIYDDILKW